MLAERECRDSMVLECDSALAALAGLRAAIGGGEGGGR